MLTRNESDTLNKVFEMLKEKSFNGFKIDDFEFKHQSGSFMFTNDEHPDITIYATPFWEGASFDFEAIVSIGSLQMKPIDFDVDVKVIKNRNNARYVYEVVKNALENITHEIY